MELWPNYLSLPEHLGNIYFHGSRKERKIALTYDDSLSEETLGLLKLLKKFNIKATFFIEGKRIEGRENILKKIKKDKHEIGNHTFSHKSLLFKSKKFIEDEIEETDKLLGIKTKIMRPPYLRIGFNAYNVCKKLGKKIVYCDAISHNWRLKGVEYAVDNVLRKTRNGSIINMHDYLENIGRNKDIIEITKRAIIELKKRHYKFITISNLLEKCL